MLSVLLFAFNTVTPILLQVLLGYALKRAGLFTEEFLRVASRLTFRCCLPAMLFCNLYTLEDIGSIDWGLGGFVLVTLAVLTLAGLLMANLVTDRRDWKGVLAQASFRSNFAIIGLPLVGTLGVPGALALASAMQAPSVIYFNLMAVVVLALYSGGEQKADIKKLLSGIAKNPLIRGLALGVLVLCVRTVIPRTPDGALIFSLAGSLPWLYSTIISVSRVATPMALMVLGGQFEFSSMRSVGWTLAAGTAMRLLAAPAIGFGMAFAAAGLGWISLTPETVSVLLALLGTPTAVSSVIMASEMGADDVLAGQLVVWTTAGSAFTMFCIIAAFRFAGLL